MTGKIKWFVKRRVLNPTISFYMGWGNGYVCIPYDHPCFEMKYENIDIEVHGGFTFSSLSDDINWPEIPKECRKNHWIVGFDTSHYGDSLQKWPKWRVELEIKRAAEELQQIQFI